MTKRAFLIGLVMVLLVAVATPYSDLVMKGTWIGLTAFPISSFCVLVLVALGLNPLLRLVGKGLDRGELLLIYCMVLVAAGIPSFGLTGLLIPYMAGPYYFASPENRWDELLLPHLPKWMAPQNKDAITYLYQGAPHGTGVPWDLWIGPLAAWTILAGALYLCFFCLASLFRKAWVDDEKLVFPLVQLPVEMSEINPLQAVGPFFRNRVMWMFFAIPFFIHTCNGLHFHFPWVPEIPVQRIDLGTYFSEPPWTALSPLWLRWSFTAIGVAYLLPTELSFSLWFFYLFFLVQQMIGAMMGQPMPNVQAYPVRQFVAHQMIGGILLYGVFIIWNARQRLGTAWRSAFTRGDLEAKGEAVGSRTAFIGLLLGLVVICCWGQVAGAGVVATLIIFLLYFVMHLVATRLVCEGGMLYVQHPFRPMNIMLAAVGSARLGPQRIVTLNLFDHLFMLDNRSPLMPCLMESLKISDRGELPRRPLTAMLAVSVMVAVVVSYASYLTLMYRYGGLTLNTWFTSYYTRNLYGTWTAHLIQQGEPASPASFFTMAIGAGTMLLLLIMHRSFLWWPFHPIGYLMGASWPMVNFWFPIFLGWLAKSIIVHYFGPKTYRYLIPGFLGLIFAEFTSAGLWVLIDFLTGVRGHEIFSF